MNLFSGKDFDWETGTFNYLKTELNNANLFDVLIKVIVPSQFHSSNSLKNVFNHATEMIT